MRCTINGSSNVSAILTPADLLTHLTNEEVKMVNENLVIKCKPGDIIKLNPYDTIVLNNTNKHITIKK